MKSFCNKCFALILRSKMLSAKHGVAKMHLMQKCIFAYKGAKCSAQPQSPVGHMVPLRPLKASQFSHIFNVKSMMPDAKIHFCIRS